MVARAGGSLVIIGHSERRALCGEDDALIGRKLRAALEAGVMPLLCIGESLDVREGDGVAGFLEQQIRGAIESFPFAGGKLIIAYEPVWAIGTGRNASSAVIAETAALIRRTIVALRPDLDDPPILYGGSVTELNARELAREADVDGFLVGGASLEAEKLEAIYEAIAL
jgi:triosephosphate isomerase